MTLTPPNGSGTPLPMDVMGRRHGLELAVATFLAVGCRSPAPAPAATVTVAVPAASADAPAEPEPEKPPWDRLLSLQAVFTGGAPEPPCPAGRAARVLVTGDDEGPRMALAQEAGCVAHPPVADGEIQLCCPAGLGSPSVTAWPRRYEA